MLSANITHTLSLLHDKHSPGSTADRCTTASSCTGDFAIRQALAPCLFLSSASLLSSSAVSTAPFLLIMKIINTLWIKIPYSCCLNQSFTMRNYITFAKVPNRKKKEDPWIETIRINITFTNYWMSYPFLLERFLPNNFPKDFNICTRLSTFINRVKTKNLRFQYSL